MELKTCENCMVVLDVTGVDRDIESHYESKMCVYDENRVTWDSDRHKRVVYIKCPVCGWQVLL